MACGRSGHQFSRSANNKAISTLTDAMSDGHRHNIMGRSLNCVTIRARARSTRCIASVEHHLGQVRSQRVVGVTRRPDARIAVRKKHESAHSENWLLWPGRRRRSRIGAVLVIGRVDPVVVVRLGRSFGIQSLRQKRAQEHQNRLMKSG